MSYDVEGVFSGTDGITARGIYKIIPVEGKENAVFI
jgi:hypothetical protein